MAQNSKLKDELQKKGESAEVDLVPSTDMLECFIIMPIADPDGYAKGHFHRVYRDIFVPA